MFSDCHAHFYGLKANEVEEVVKRAEQEGIEIIIIVGMDLESSAEAANIAETYDIVYSAVGIHPWNAVTIDETLYRKLKALASRKKVAAISEIGLDFTGDPRQTESRPPDSSNKEVQKQAFTEQLRLARDLGKPVVIHHRGALPEVLGILKKERDVKAVLHNFMGDESMLWEAVDLGCYCSVGRAIFYPDTIPNLGKFQQMVKEIPAERLLLETDMSVSSGVFMSWDVKRVAEYVAQLQGKTAEEIGAITTNNLSHLLYPGGEGA